MGTLLGQGRAGFIDGDGVFAKVGHAPAAAAASRHWRPGWRSFAGCPSGPGPSTRGQVAPLVEQALPACSYASTFPASCRWPGLVCDVRNRDLVRPPEAFEVVAVDFSRRSPTLGAAQNDHRPSRAKRLAGLRAPAVWTLRISITQCSRVAAIAWCMVSGSLAFDKVRRAPVAEKQRSQAPRGWIRARMVGLLIL